MEIEKWVWTEADLQTMGWHDARIHAVAFRDKGDEGHELLFDIDYILKWIEPRENEQFFSFQVSPATLVFEWVWDLEFDTGSYIGGLQIDGIKREESDNPRSPKWTVDCQEGEITFRSSGFRQYLRTEPIWGGQELDPATRGYSFARGRTDVDSTGQQAGSTALRADGNG